MDLEESQVDDLKRQSSTTDNLRDNHVDVFSQKIADKVRLAWSRAKVNSSLADS